MAIAEVETPVEAPDAGSDENMAIAEVETTEGALAPGREEKIAMAEVETTEGTLAPGSDEKMAMAEVETAPEEAPLIDIIDKSVVLPPEIEPVGDPTLAVVRGPEAPPEDGAGTDE